MEITKNENRPVDAVVDIQEPNDTVNPMAPADTDRPEAQPCSCGGTPEEPKKKKCCGQCCVNLLTIRQPFRGLWNPAVQIRAAQPDSAELSSPYSWTGCLQLLRNRSARPMTHSLQALPEGQCT